MILKEPGVRSLALITIHTFTELVWAHYQEHKRVFPWRWESDSYKIVISECMLQQTQTQRVLYYYPNFLEAFPSWHVLAAADLFDVIKAWQGLGYNRRAKYLHDMAKKIVAEHEGKAPDTIDELCACKGIGINTAGSICAFAFNKPEVFVETNIRTVFIHHFFPNQDKVAEKDIRALVEQTLDQENPREWYYALTDYGVYLKKEHGNASSRGASYTKQSKFRGSLREIRGAILRTLVEKGSGGLRMQDLYDMVISDLLCEKDRYDSVFAVLCREGLCVCDDNLVVKIL